MRLLRTWPLLCAGFGVLLLLIFASALMQQNSLEKVYSEVAEIQRLQRESSQSLDRLRSEHFLVAIFIRDYLLQPSPEDAETERRTLQALRASMQGDLAALELRAKARHHQLPKGLQDAVVAYWRSVDTVLAWDPKEKLARGSRFLRTVLVPQRDAVLAAASQVAELSAAETQERQQLVLKTEQELKNDLRRNFGIALFVGLVVAIASIWRTRALESEAAAHLRHIEHSTDELRRLSQALSAAQEDERRSISRELHDQVGQMLTALRMELANLEEFRTVPGDEFAQHMTEARSIAEDTLRSLRNISMGLRPSMLDELGLGPALNWQAREFGRRSGVPVEFEEKGSFGIVPEGVKTCLYRVAQEALTNCARHAAAGKIRILLEGNRERISLRVEDNGIGFDLQQSRGRGLGLLGIEERVMELGGTVQIHSEPSKGTLVCCTIPLARRAAAL